MAQKELLKPQHLGDGVYVHDEGYRLALAVNHHENKVIFIEESEIRALIAYAKKTGFLST
jgi:hypothetical protein